MIRYSALTLCLSVSACATPQSGVWTDRAPRFDDEIRAFAASDAVMPPQRCATLFVGSSSIRMWPNLAGDFPFPTIQRGVGGSTISEIDSYFGRIVAPYQPSRIVFYAGENDLNEGKSPEATFADLKRFMALKRGALGTTPVYFISAKPSPSRASDLGKQVEFNRLAQAYAGREKDLVFIDVAKPMLVDRQPVWTIFGPDNLHMLRAGYDIWVKAIGAELAKPAPTRNPACPA